MRRSAAGMPVSCGVWWGRWAGEAAVAADAGLLGGDGGRARIIRLPGPEDNGALDEFLELALSYEQKAPASLQGFMAWLRAAETEVKRDMEIRRDEVRVRQQSAAVCRSGVGLPGLGADDFVPKQPVVQRLEVRHVQYRPELRSHLRRLFRVDAKVPGCGHYV